MADPKDSLVIGMNDQRIFVLSPDRDILHFEPRLVVALNPLEEEKRVQTDIVLFAISKDQPEFEARSFVYFFAGAYDLKGIFRLWRGMPVAKPLSYFTITSKESIPNWLSRWLPFD